jgi:cytochrome c-type biogenesis protein CcmH
MSRLVFQCLFCLFFCGLVASADAKVSYPYQFSSEVQAQRFKNLLNELRCLVCQNQSLSESNAPLAVDLKQQIYFQILTGSSDAEIKHYLVKRYGEYILLKPRVSSDTLVLWLGPVMFLVGSFIIFFFSIRKYNRANISNSNNEYEISLPTTETLS